MRIAAGIVLIVAALFNGCAGSGYVLGGAVVGGAGKLGSALQEAADKQQTSGQMSAKDKADFDKAMGQLKGASTTAQAAGGLYMVFGLFLWVLLGLQIGAAVVLFMGKAKNFALTVGVLTGVAEIVGIVLIGFHLWAILGFAAAALAIVAAQGYAKAQASAPPAAAA
jgi:hypothetical protein